MKTQEQAKAYYEEASQNYKALLQKRRELEAQLRELENEIYCADDLLSRATTQLSIFLTPEQAKSLKCHGQY